MFLSFHTFLSAPAKAACLSVLSGQSSVVCLLQGTVPSISPAVLLVLPSSRRKACVAWGSFLVVSFPFPFLFFLPSFFTLQQSQRNCFPACSSPCVLPASSNAPFNPTLAGVFVAVLMCPCESAFAWLRAYDFYFLKKWVFLLSKRVCWAALSLAFVKTDAQSSWRALCCALPNGYFVCAVLHQVLNGRDTCFLPPLLLSSFLYRSRIEHSLGLTMKGAPIGSHTMCLVPNWLRSLEKIEKS